MSDMNEPTKTQKQPPDMRDGMSPAWEKWLADRGESPDNNAEPEQAEAPEPCAECRGATITVEPATCGTCGAAVRTVVAGATYTQADLVTLSRALAAIDALED